VPDEARTLTARAVARAAAPYVGAALAVVSLGIVAWQVGELATQLKAQLADWSILPGVLVLSLLYGLSLFALGSAWALLVPRPAAAVTAARGALLRAYGVSSLSKYLPGNIFHFAGRQVLGARLGWGHASLATATLLEIALSVLTALLIALTLMAFADVRLAGIAPWHAGIAWVAVLGLVATLELKGDRTGLLTRRGTVPPARGSLAAATSCCALFFLSSALLAIGCYVLLYGRPDDAAAIGAAYVLAWVAGYVVPGAPGGVGIREAAFLGILSPLVSPASALAVALIMRLVTTLGDALFAGTCKFLLPASPES
jgi:uncharacterized membrane protein YbhN (UPF0104 family)